MLPTFARFPSMLCFLLLTSLPRHPVKLKIVEKRITEREIKGISNKRVINLLRVPVVQKLDSAMHSVNLYSADKYYENPLRYIYFVSKSLVYASQFLVL